MKKNIIYIVLIITLLITTGINVMDRVSVESDAKSVEITLSYDDFEEMADQSEHDLIWWFEFFKNQGVYSVALYEETFQSVIESDVEIESEILMNLNKDTLWELRYPESFVQYIKTTDYDKNDVVIVTEDEAALTFILEGMEKRYPEDFYSIFEDQNKYAILLDGQFSDLRHSQIYTSLDEDGKGLVQHQDVIGSDVLYYGIGFDDNKVTTIQDSGLFPHLRPWNNQRYPENVLDVYFESLEKYDVKPTLLMFTGKEVLGYPAELKRTNDWMIENNVTPTLIETGVQRSNTDQLGLFDITENTNYQAVRLLPIVEYMQERFKAYNYEGGEEIENTIFRAVTERNIKIIYMRPYLLTKEVYVTDPDEYKASFERINDRLAMHNMELGPFSLMPFNDEKIYTAILIGLGLIAVIILAARFFFRFPSWFEYLILVFGGVCVTGALVVAPNLGRQLLALVAAITVSSLGAVLMIEFARDRFTNKQVFRTRVILLRSILITFAFGILAMIGGLIIGGLLSHSKYLLEIGFFRGVKISEILPLLVFIVLYLLKFGYNRTADEIRTKEIMPKDLFRFLNINIKMSYILVAAIGGFILYIYVARSGHETTVQPSNLEMIVRNFLELKLIARPRTKEFLAAIPAMMIFVYVVYKGYKPLIALTGIPAVIMFISIINTFCHLRTPIYISVSRSLIGIGFGILIGSILIVIADLAERLIKRLLKRGLKYITDEKKELGA